MTDAQKAEREEASRAAFEALSGWQAEHLHRSRTATGRYFRYDVQSEWEAWQAGATWAASQSAAEVAALRARVAMFEHSTVIAAGLALYMLRNSLCLEDRQALESLAPDIQDLLPDGEVDATDVVATAVRALAATQPKEPTP